MKLNFLNIFVVVLILVSFIFAPPASPALTQQLSNKVLLIYEERECTFQTGGEKVCEKKGFIPVVLNVTSSVARSTEEFQRDLEECLRTHTGAEAQEQCGYGARYNTGGTPNFQQYLSEVVVDYNAEILDDLDYQNQIAFRDRSGNGQILDSSAVDCSEDVTYELTQDDVVKQVRTKFCAIDKDLYYKETCNNFVAFYRESAASPVVQSSNSLPMRICDNEISAFSNFDDALTTFFTPCDPTSGSISQCNAALPVATCFAAFGLIGLLLASLYFSGRSPITLLDISTPRLPSPKTFAAGGQILGGFGYTEMKKTARGKMGAAVKAFAALSSANINRRFFADADAFVAQARLAKGGKEAYADKLMEGADSTNFLKSLHVLAKKAGVNDAELNALRMNPRHFDEAQQRTLAEVINKIRRQGGSSELAARALEEFHFANITMHHLEQLTGAPDIGQRSAVFSTMQFITNKMFGASRFIQLGGFASGALDSMIRSTQLGWRATKATVALVPKIPIDIAASLGHTGARTLKSGKFYHKLDELTGGLVELGGFFPIREKMNKQYETMLSEAYHDLERGLIAEMLKKKGMRFAMAEEELMAIAYREVDLLHECGYSEGAGLNRLDAELRRILADRSLSDSEKLARLITIARNEGVARAGIISEVIAEHAALDTIASSSDHGHVKLITLYDHLANERPRFNYAIAKDDLHGHQLFEVMIVRSYIFEAENGHLDHAKNGIKATVMQTYLHELNRLVTLNPTSSDPFTGIKASKMFGEVFGVNEQVYGKIEQQAVKYLKELVTDEGRTVLDKYLRMSKSGRNFETATIGDFMGILYGYRELHLRRGIDLEEKVFDPKSLLPETGSKYEPFSRKSRESAGQGVYIDPQTKKALFWEEMGEMGPKENWWQADMKRHWISPSGRESLCIAEWVQNRVERGHFALYDAETERRMRSDPRVSHLNPDDVHSWTPSQITDWRRTQKQLLVEKQMREDLKQYFNGLFGQNMYSNTHETVNFYAKGLAGFLSVALERRNDPLLETLNVRDKQHLRDFTDLVRSKNGELDAYIKRGVNYNSLIGASHPWVQPHETGWMPHVAGMKLSPYDRILNGYAAIKDDHGNYRRFDPTSSRVDLRRISHELAAEFNRLGGMPEQEGMPNQPNVVKATGRIIAPTKDSEQWRPFLDKLRDHLDLENNYEHRKTFASVLWAYSDHTGSYDAELYNLSGLSVRSKREVAPNNPFRGFTLNQENFMGMDLAGKWPMRFRNAMLSIGDTITKGALAAGGPLLHASYGISPASEIFRMHSWRLAHDVLRMDDRDWNRILSDVDPRERDQVRRNFVGLAMEHGAWHVVWDFAIDRNPWRTEASYGVHQAWGGFFGFGPGSPYGIRMNVRPYMSKSEYIGYMAQQGWIQSIARVASKPYTAVFRGIQQEMQGYASRWDTTPDPLRHWNYTDVRRMSALRALANPISTFKGSEFNWVPGALDRIGFHQTAERFQTNLSQGAWSSSTKWSHLSGEEHSRGLLQGPLDIFYSRMGGGVYSSARTGGANPAVSYYDPRFVLHTDQPAAGYAVTGVGAQRGFYQGHEYTASQAYGKTVNRDVSDVAMLMRRELELKGFGAGQNPIYAWFSPISYIWHSGIYSWAGIGNPFMPYKPLKDIMMVGRTHGWGAALKEAIPFSGTVSSLANKTGTPEFRRQALAAKVQMMMPQNAAKIISCTCGKNRLRGSRCTYCGAVG